MNGKVGGRCRWGKAGKLSESRRNFIITKFPKLLIRFQDIEAYKAPLLHGTNGGLSM